MARKEYSNTGILEIEYAEKIRYTEARSKPMFGQNQSLSTEVWANYIIHNFDQNLTSDFFAYAGFTAKNYPKEYYFKSTLTRKSKMIIFSNLEVLFPFRVTKKGSMVFNTNIF